MQSTRRFNKRQPVSVTALPINKVGTPASPGNTAPVQGDTSSFHQPDHLEQTSTHHDHTQLHEALTKTTYEPVTDIHNHNHNHTPYHNHQEQLHPGYGNSYHNDDDKHKHNHGHAHDQHQQQHMEHNHQHDTGYGHQHQQINNVAGFQSHTSYHSQQDSLHHDHSSHNHSDGHNCSQNDHSHNPHSHGDHDRHHSHSHGDHHHSHAHDDHHRSHSHDDHSHHHHHSYPPVFTPPLPSWSELFSTLSPSQKTIFTWFMIHLAIAIWVYCIGISNGTLAVVGFSYLVIFDALGVLNSFVCSIIRTSPSYGYSNTKRPFGAHRYEIIFAMATTVYLLFATMHNTKESLEHFLLEGHHGGGEHHEASSSFGFGSFLAISVAIGTCCLACVALRNHDNFVRFLRRTPPTVHGYSYNVVNRARGNPLHVIMSNVYSFSIISCGLLVLAANMLGLASSSIDKLLALMESVVMFYLGYPTVKALANLLLQTTPNTVRNGVETRLYEIRQDPNIISVDRVHFWQNTYGRCVGTLEVQIQGNADEQAVLQFIYQKLEGLTSSSSSGGGDGYDDAGQPSELTVSIIKN